MLLEASLPAVRELDLSQQALTLSNPNPRVGCVITHTDGGVLGEGFTQAAGQAHAEVMARHDAIGKQVHVISQPSGDRRFLIAGISPQALRDNYRFWVRLHLLLMLAAVVGFALAGLP